jgi:phytoene synthase
VVTALVSGRAGDELALAYAHCERVARAHYENFPVASLLLPARMRPHIAAIYAFARAADDFADEPGIPDTERFRLLDTWHDFLENGARHPSAQSAARLSVMGTDDVFLALHHTIRECRLPVPLFEDLLSAFRQDITTKRYATWIDVLDYCRRSANPIGRLVLRVAGYDDPRLDAASDAVCTALQLTNFWQDLDRDWTNGRLYMPLEERDRAGALDDDLDAKRMTAAWREALSAAAGRTRDLYAHGRGICDAVSGRLKWDLRLTWLGGSRILERLERSGFDVFHSRPTLGLTDVPVLVWRAARWKRDL